MTTSSRYPQRLRVDRSPPALPAALGSREQAAQTAKDATSDLQASPSHVANADVAKATVDLQLQEAAYQAALATIGRVPPSTLLDFLR
jgi:flagellin-like hook-associated protein FlgL